MRWLALFALSCLFSLEPFWAEGQSTSSTGPLPAASAGAWRPPSATWETFDYLLSRLESSAEDSSADSARLKSSLEDARSRLSELSARLTESSTLAGELSSSLGRCERSLALSEASLREARAAAARNELELWIWRGAAVLGVAAGAAGLGWGIAAATSR